MVQPFGNIPQLQNSGIGIGASAISSTIGNLLGLQRQREANKQSLINSLIQQGGAALRQSSANEAAAERAQANRPVKLLGVVDDLENAALAAERAGNLDSAQQLRARGQEIIGSVFGGGGLLGQGPTTDQASPQVPAGIIPPPPGVADEVGSLLPPSGFQPVAAQNVGSQVGQGDEFDTGSGDPLANQPVVALDPGASPSIAGQVGGFSTPVQKERLDVIRKGGEAAKSQFQLGKIQSFDNVLNAPDGAILTGSGNVKFEGIDINPDTKSFLSQGKDVFAANPQEFTKKRGENAQQARTLFSFFDLLEKIEPAVSSDFGADFRLRVASDPLGLPRGSGAKILKSLGVKGKEFTDLTRAVSANQQP